MNIMEVFLIQHLFDLIVIVTLTIMGFGYRLILREIRQQKTEHEAIKNLLRSELISMHVRYIPQKEIPIYALETVQGMYQAYHNLGGNGTITKLVDEMMSLPARKG